MTVAFLTNDFVHDAPTLTPGGCAFYRCYLPMSVLNTRAHMGRPAWDPLRGWGVQESKTTGIFGFSTVSLKLLMDRWTPKQVELGQKLGQRIVVDIDDFFDGLTPDNHAYYLTHPERNKRTNRDNYAEVIARADTLTVTTPFLLDYYSAVHHDVRMVRNGVHYKMFTLHQHRDRKPVIGWVGSTGYRNGDLELLREWLPDFLEEHDLRFHHSGWHEDHPDIADVTGINPDRVTYTPLVPITSYAEVFHHFDIGLVPLTEIDFNRAKSNIKGLEYGSAGIPFVASDLPEYRLLHEDGAGLLARTADDWRAQVEWLLDYRNRKEAARQTRQTITARWGIDSRADEWRDVFR